MTFAALLADPELKRPLTVRERVFLMAVESAGYEMELWRHNGPRPDCFLIEQILEDPRGYPHQARIALETLDVLEADSSEVRATMLQLVAATRWPSAADCVAALERAGLEVARERKGDLVSVDRGLARVWLDVGETVRVVADPSDSDHELFLDVLEILDGPMARARHKAALIGNETW